MKMRVKFTGGEEIQRRLEMLPREIAGKPLREAAMAGAEVIRQEAVRNAQAHQRTGTLAGDIHAEIAKESLGERVVVHIGPGKKGWYGRLVEMGHALVRGSRKADKRVIGQVPPHPWLRPALDTKKEEAKQAMAEEMERRLERIWPRK